MKIVILATGTDAIGGSSRNVGNMIAALKIAGHDVQLFGYKNNFFDFVKKAHALAKSADVVHALDINPVGIAGYFATRFTRAKFVIVGQAAYAVAPLHNKKTAIFAQLVYRAADGVIAGSTYVAGEIQKKIPGLPIAVIDPGIDMSRFSSMERSNISTEAPYLLSVGAVKVRKGFEISLRAFASLKDSMPRLRYVIVGSLEHEPLYVEMLKKLAHELGVGDRVDFLGEVADEKLKQLYEGAAIFILTSTNKGFHFEGFGMVFLEAAAYGIPTIGTTGNGIADAIDDGKTGILVPQNDVTATAQAIVKILSDADMAQRMSVRAQAFVQEHDLNHIADAYTKFYDGLFSGLPQKKSVYVYQIERDLLLKQIAACAHYIHGDVLDIGGGEMNRYRHLFACKTFTRLDIRPYPGLEIVASADNIPLPDESQDSVLSTQVLEHVLYPEACVQEMCRVLKKGGHALITVPQWNELHDEPVDFWRYTKYGLTQLFERNGFAIVECNQRGGFFTTSGQMTIRYFLDRFHLHHRPVWGRIASRVFRALSLVVQFLDRIDTSVANRKHTIGWCFVLIKK